MAFCVNCGIKLDDTDNFCPTCGKAVRNASPNQQQSASPPQPVYDSSIMNQGAPSQQQAYTQPNNNYEFAGYNAKDIAGNKAMAILAYIGFFGIDSVIGSQRF